MGIDLGGKRIGVAVSAGSLATPYQVLERSASRVRDHQAIAALVEELGAEVVVVGLPRSLDGSLRAAARAVLAEVEELAEAVEVPIETYDERLTTVTAQRQLSESGVRAGDRRRIVDQVAAAVILQSWLDGLSSDAERGC